MLNWYRRVFPVYHCTNLFSNLEAIIRHQRLQYLGSVPFVVEETINSNLQQLLKDKQRALVSLRNAQTSEFDSLTLKEQLTTEVQLTNELKQTLDRDLQDAVLKISAWHQERSMFRIKVGTKPSMTAIVIKHFVGDEVNSRS